MQEQNSRKRPDMKFIQMDATQMSFEDKEFSVALDKGKQAKHWPAEI